MDWNNFNTHFTVEFLLFRDNALDLALKLVNLNMEFVDALLQQSATNCKSGSVQLDMIKIQTRHRNDAASQINATLELHELTDP